MRLTWQIVMKDLTRLRLPLALWVFVFLCEFAIGVRLLRGEASGFELFDRLMLFDYVIYGLQVAIGYVLVAALVHEDPLVGTTAFWPTRPISGARLLGAKVLGCLLIFGVLPLIVTLPWWLFCGYGSHEVARATLDALGSHLVPMLVGLAIAVLTGTLSRFLAGTFLTVAFLGTLLLVATAGPSFNDLYGSNSGLRFEISDERIRWLIYLVLAGLSIVVAHQFLTRRLTRSLVILGCTLGLFLFGAVQQPLSPEHFFDHGKWSAPSLVTADNLAIEFKDAYLGYVQPSDDKMEVLLRERFSVTNIPPGLYLSFYRSELEWSWPDGSQLNRTANVMGGHQPRLPVPHQPPSEWWDWMRVHGYPGWNSHGSFENFIKSLEETPGPIWEFNEQVPRELVARMRSDPPACTADFRGFIVRWDPYPEIALAPGSRWQGNGQGIRVGRMRWDSRSQEMSVALARHQPAIGGVFSPYVDVPRMWYAPINRRLGEGIGWRRGWSSVSIRIATVAITWFEMPCTAPRHWVGDKWVSQSSEDWLSDATIVSSVETTVGQFERKVTIGRFGPNPEQSGGPP